MATASLTDKDREIMVWAWECFKSPPEVDHDKLTELGGYKNRNSAGAVYAGVKKKLLSAAKLTQKDREIIVWAWQCFKSQPQVDYAKLVEKGGYKNSASAAAVYSGVKKKLLGDAAPGGAEKAGAKKRKASDSKDTEENPVAKKRGRKTKASGILERTVDNPRYPDQYDSAHDSAHDSTPNAADNNNTVKEDTGIKIKKETEDSTNGIMLEDAGVLQYSENDPDLTTVHHGIKQEGSNETWNDPVNGSFFDTARTLLSDLEATDGEDVDPGLVDQAMSLFK